MSANRFGFLDKAVTESSDKNNSSNDNKPKRTVISGSDFLLSPPATVSRGNYLLECENGDRFYLTDEMLATGLMLLGSTGCGKTTTLLKLLDQIVTKMTSEDVMIIFDSKHDFRNRYYNPSNPNHILVSLDEKDKNISAIWNIFLEILQASTNVLDNLDLNCREIANMLFEGLESETQPIFNLSASDFMSKILATTVQDVIDDARRTGSRQFNVDNMNNASLNKLLSEKDIKKILDITTTRSKYEYLKSYIGDGKSNQALGIYAYMSAAKQRTLVNRFAEYDRNRMLCITDFIRNKGGKILFLEYDHRYKETLSVVYSLFYNLAIKEALTVKGGNKWFICDEANLIPYVTGLQDLLNVGRSFGCKTIFGLQTFAQLRNQYDDAEAESIAAGFCNLFAFHNTDYSSRQYVKQRSGEVLEAYNYGGQNIHHDSFTVRDSDLQNLLPGQAFVDLKHHQIFKTRFKM